MEEVVVENRLQSLFVSAFIIGPLLLSAGDASAQLSPREDSYYLKLLGKNIFFDTISKPEDVQACASCHDPAKGWILPNSQINASIVVAPGAKRGRFGSIKPPMSAYASFSPPFQNSPVPVVPSPWLGGNFWNGRAEGCGAPDAPVSCGAVPLGQVSDTITWQDLNLPDTYPYSNYKVYLGPTADQALNPFPNPVEQNIRIKRVCTTVKQARYSNLYEKAFGESIKCNSKADETGKQNYETAYKRIALSLGAWQSSKDVNSFSSKRDLALSKQRSFPNRYLTEQENLGHELFYGLPRKGPPGFQGNGAGCFACHNGVPEGDTLVGNGTEPRQLYSDNRYHNLGLPYNPAVPGITKGQVNGLLAHVTDEQPGNFRTPSMRNVNQGVSRGFTKAYMHNGYFKSLDRVVRFYNRHLTMPVCASDRSDAQASATGCFPAAEFPNATDIAPSFLVGDIGLTDTEEAALVAYLKTLSDSYTPQKP